ncbi:MerR family transcriptional regulator [Paenibacillaceae bacterium WGS1546]|uniref:MerR family transcriptional regulator n=1 Tax=Cohnella sp. WGS1546 TaxID=3366810 RepID=UPI00372D66C0
MRIQEVRKHLNVTRKAVEYYIEQALLRPSVLENGYRDFNQEDVEQIRKIMILRKLGLGISEIRNVLAAPDPSHLRQQLIRQELRQTNENERLAILRQLSVSGDWQEAERKLLALDQQATVTDKLLEAFPNDFGLFIALHFAPFFPAAILSGEQQSAYEEIVSYLDDTASMDIPAEWSNWLKDQQSELTVTDWRKLSTDMIDAARQPEAFWEKHQQNITAYLNFKQSEAYRQSPAFQMQQLLQRLQQDSGYHERFIPALKRLSPAYSEYARQLERADELLRDKYSGVEQQMYSTR